VVDGMGRQTCRGSDQGLAAGEWGKRFKGSSRCVNLVGLATARRGKECQFPFSKRQLPGSQHNSAMDGRYDDGNARLDELRMCTP